MSENTDESTELPIERKVPRVPPRDQVYILACARSQKILAGIWVSRTAPLEEL